MSASVECPYSGNVSIFIGANTSLSSIGIDWAAWNSWYRVVVDFLTVGF